MKRRSDFLNFVINEIWIHDCVFRHDIVGSESAFVVRLASLGHVTKYFAQLAIRNASTLRQLERNAKLPNLHFSLLRRQRLIRLNFRDLGID
jgi:hypothetical protein